MGRSPLTAPPSVTGRVSDALMAQAEACRAMMRAIEDTVMREARPLTDEERASYVKYAGVLAQIACRAIDGETARVVEQRREVARARQEWADAQARRAQADEQLRLERWARKEQLLDERQPPHGLARASRSDKRVRFFEPWHALSPADALVVPIETTDILAAVADDYHTLAAMNSWWFRAAESSPRGRDSAGPRRGR